VQHAHGTMETIRVLVEELGHQIEVATTDGLRRSSDGARLLKMLDELHKQLEEAGDAWKAKQDVTIKRVGA